MFEKKNNENINEEKTKNIPKKLDMSKFEEKFKQEKKFTERQSFVASSNFKEKLLKFNSTIKEEKKEEKFIPKKIDTRRLSIMVSGNLKGIDIAKEVKEMGKINIDKHLKQMKEEENLKNANNVNCTKSIPKKLCIEDILINLKNSNKKVTVIRRKIPKKINIEEKLKNMLEDKILNENKNVKIDEDSFENLSIRNRSSTVSGRLSNIKEMELEKKKIEEEKKLIEEERKKRYEERKKREEERKKREEEERKREEERKKREEEERKKREEEERKKREEEERIQREKDRVKYEEEKKKREEEERKREEERKKREEEERIRREEERKKREEEERIRREEEEKKKKEEDEKFKIEGLKRLNKKEEDFTENELKSLIESVRHEKKIEEYNKIKFRNYDEIYEGKDIKYTFEEINQISTEPLSNLEVTKTGKLVTLGSKQVSKITIYTEKTYKEENCILLESKVNSIKVANNKIYCALEESTDNILIISLDNFEEKTYLSEHNYGVTDLTLTKQGYMVSADIKGNIVVWSDNKIKKKGNDFNDLINTITEVDEGRQRIAILSFRKEQIKFYDLRTSYLFCIETICNIKGSGLKNNMLKLNSNILAVSGTYIYIIDLNSLIITNMINCIYANDSISSFHFNNRGFFFVSQALTGLWFDDLDKGTLGYYQYNFKNEIIPDKNTLVKLASKSKCHDHFISSIKQIDSETIVTGSFDGKIKFWNLKEIN